MSPSSLDSTLCAAYSQLKGCGFSDVAVCLQGDNGHIHTYTHQNGSTFRNAISLLNACAAIKSRSPAIQAILAELHTEDVRTSSFMTIPIVSSLPSTNSSQGAALVRDEGALVVWADSVDSVLSTCRELEHRLRHIANHCRCTQVTDLPPKKRHTTLEDSFLFGSGDAFDFDAWFAPGSTLAPLNELSDLHNVHSQDLFSIAPCPPLDSIFGPEYSTLGLQEFQYENDVAPSPVWEASPASSSGSSLFMYTPPETLSLPQPEAISPALTLLSPLTVSPALFAPVPMPAAVSPAAISPAIVSPALFAPMEIEPTPTPAPAPAPPMITIDAAQIMEPVVQHATPALPPTPLPAASQPETANPHLLQPTPWVPQGSRSPAVQTIALSAEAPAPQTPAPAAEPVLPSAQRKRGRPKGSGITKRAALPPSPSPPPPTTSSAQQLALCPLPGRPSAHTKRAAPNYFPSLPVALASPYAAETRVVGQKAKRAAPEAEQPACAPQPEFAQGSSRDSLLVEIDLFGEESEDEDEDDEYVDYSAPSPSPPKRPRQDGPASCSPAPKKPRRQRKAGQPKRRHSCENCHRTFGRRTDLKRHRMASRCGTESGTAVVGQKCRWCNQVFNRTDAAVRHERSVHKDEMHE
ncbi:hypothetical protein WOLCODRAFT_167673 [Wolfiporia cocos MD-104 SS10]|uniref:C2H2-type domain-containing protein n=1 Tax=Wolfiporia cocos (strain MD-104) TaxID=742152 RepID=A0A2H3JS73_WOLCO|nr:hypothetical protein WOLCODRAFT_167673 [Wolfiporia cocos MD-104 SS10]